MNYAEQATLEIMTYLNSLEALGGLPDVMEIQRIIQFYTTEHQYFLTYGHYPSNPQI